MALRKSFTLVEILVVTTIISLLGTVGYGSFSVASKNSRDSKRKSDLEYVKTNLSIYYQANSSYPETIPLDGSPFIENGTTYIDKTPQDPLSVNGYNYFYQITSSSFVVCALLENYSQFGYIDGTKCRTNGTKCNYCATISGNYLADGSYSVGPTAVPTSVPVPTAVPTSVPVPTAVPTSVPVPTAVPTSVPVPTAVPTSVPVPTAVPTSVPVPTAIPAPVTYGTYTIGCATLSSNTFSPYGGSPYGGYPPGYIDIPPTLAKYATITMVGGGGGDCRASIDDHGSNGIYVQTNTGTRYRVNVNPQQINAGNDTGGFLVCGQTTTPSWAFPISTIVGIYSLAVCNSPYETLDINVTLYQN